MSGADETTETSSLLISQSNVPLPEQQRAQYSWGAGSASRTVGLASISLVLYAFSDVLRYIATVRLIEQGVCREYYLRHGPGFIDDGRTIPGDLCAIREVQQGLAHLRGYQAALEAIVPLLATLPYGLLVERFGERLLAGINIIGYLVSCAWLLVVYYGRSIVPIWCSVLSPLFMGIGGALPVFESIIYILVARHVPDANRSASLPM
ncbi:hypothetical protein BBP40_001325 [Aspergillus hancockii]|nr:hypothetical protein BBP40_001325 [Aspergillus hancockii]